jgi:predicted small lipoprotein YifL
MMKLFLGFFVGCVALAVAGCTQSGPLAPPLEFQADQSVSDTTQINLYDLEATAEGAEADSGSSRGIGGFGSGN